MATTVEIFVDGQPMTVPAGISVAAAVLGHDHENAAFHTNSMDGSKRGPYCLMGVCFECMMEINGQENVQSCLVPVQNGMQIKRQLQGKTFAYSVQENFNKSATQEVEHD